MLPDDTFSPTDLKMCFMAFDQNRNGRVSEDEFIACITTARESQPPIENSAAKPFGLAQTLSSI